MCVTGTRVCVRDNGNTSVTVKRVAYRKNVITLHKELVNTNTCFRCVRSGEGVLCMKLSYGSSA